AASRANLGASLILLSIAQGGSAAMLATAAASSSSLLREGETSDFPSPALGETAGMSGQLTTNAEASTVTQAARPALGGPGVNSPTLFWFQIANETQASALGCAAEGEAA